MNFFLWGMGSLDVLGTCLHLHASPPLEPTGRTGSGGFLGGTGGSYQNWLVPYRTDRFHTEPTIFGLNWPGSIWHGVEGIGPT